MYYMQYITSACVGLSIASTSLHVLWPSVAIPKILAQKSPMRKNITGEEISWIVMSLLLGTIIGAMVSGWLLKTIGRRKCLLLFTTPLFLLWFPIAFTNSMWLLYIERCLAGVAISALIIVVTLYNSEISDKDIRGRLGTTLSGCSLVGELIVSCTGPFLNYQVLALFNCALPLLSVILVYFMPESPYYLVQIGKKSEAKINLERLMSGAKNQSYVNDVMNDIETTVEMEMKNDSSMWGFLTKPMYRKSLIIIFGIKLLQQLSGSSAFGEFTGKIIESCESKYSRDEWKIILNAVPLVGVLLSGVFVDKVGRKCLLIISLAGCTVTLIAEGVCCTMSERLQQDIHSISWLATGSLLIYSVMRSLGIGTLPYVLMGEMFATNIRHHAVAFCGTINAVTGFIMLKYFGRVNDVDGLHITFWIFVAICILGLLFVYFVIPETKCKTFAEIQKDLLAEDRTSVTKIRVGQI